MLTVYTKGYSLPHVNRKEVLRYAGVKEPSEEVFNLLDEALLTLNGKLSPKVCYGALPVLINGSTVNLGGLEVLSSDLSKNLAKSSSAVIFAATLGLEFDRVLTRLSAISPAKAFMLQAIGAERVEALCALFNNEIKEEAALSGKRTAPRFSPGYGDLSLEFQRDIFRILDCPKRIGLSLNESLLMSPSKSVSAIIGISD